MASILRSSKFVRYFAGFARNVIFNTSREVEGTLVQQNQCICGSLANGFATASKADQSLELSLKKLDQDVRRSGRISRRDIEEVLEEIRHQKTATSSQSLMVIRCCGNLVPEELPEVRTALVLEIWKTLNKLKVPMDISHYNALLRVYLENEHPFSPTEFLMDLESKGIEPNRVTFQRLISRYCQEGDIEGATRILEFMREKQHPVNENVFNALIMGHSRAGDMESAAGIISVMQQASLEPSADTYTTLLCGYAYKGDIENIKSTLDICDKKDVFLLDKDYLDIIYALAENGHADKIDPLVERLRKAAGYNQDAVNVILRLCNKGIEDVALKLLKTMPRGVRNDGETTDTGNFFIKQLVRSGRPAENIMKLCTELEESGLNSKPLLVAIEAGLANGKIETTLPLLKEAKRLNLPVRQHYFWPLICAAKSKGNEGIMDILSQMQNDFDMTPSSETIREYVIPNIKIANTYEEVITLLRSAGISWSTAATSTIFYLLSKDNLKDAANIACSGNAYLSPGLFRKPIHQALGATNDFKSYVKLIRQIHDNLTRLDQLKQKKGGEENQVEESIEDQNSDLPVSTNQREILGQMIQDAAIYFRKNRVENMTKIFNGLIEEGLSISNSQAEKIQDIFGSELNPEISTLLGKLSSGDLEPKTLERDSTYSSQPMSINQMSVEQLERLIQTVEAKGENSKNLKRFLLAAAIKLKDLDKTESVVNRLNAEGYILASGVYAQLIDLYTYHEKLENAMDVLANTKSKEPDFILDNIKTVKLANLLIKNDRLDDALKLLDENAKPTEDDSKVEEKSFNYKTTCWRSLNFLAEAGKVNEVQMLFDNFVKNNYIEVSNIMLGPFIKVHLVNNDLKMAVDKFEEICNKHQVTPWKNELACKLIQSEDAVNLQRLTDLSTNIHGEVNSLYDLVFSFVECGRIRQARKILETPGLRSRPQRINSACERYLHEGMVQSLEGLMEATKDLNHIDRSEIFYNLLVTYCKEDNPDKALGLWTKLQEENIPPSENFLTTLGKFLQSKGLDVPFAMPNQIVSNKNVETDKSSQKTVKKISLTDNNNAPIVSETVSEGIRSLRQALKKGDIEAAIKTKQNLSPTDKLNINDHSIFIENLLKAGRINEATKMVTKMLDENIHPIPRIFRFYLNKLAAAGDHSTLVSIGSNLSSKTKKELSYDNRVCHANIVAGRIELYLNNLVEKIDKAKTAEEISMASEEFPRGGAAGILEKDASLIDKFEQVAEKYAAKGIVSPMNVLWVHHFIKENITESQRIWDKYLVSAPRIMFQRIVHTARETSDEKLALRLIDLLKQTKVTDGAIGNAYSCLLDVYVAKEKYDDAVNVLDATAKDIPLESFNRTALVRVKNGLEKNGKTFAYKIPDKNAKNKVESSDSSSSSSSSSDDEDKAKEKH